MKKRFFAAVMSLCMIVSMLPVAAFAEKPGGTPESEPTCICETKCAEGSPNAECSVCGAKGADLTQCMGVEEITEPDCTCEIKCAEGSFDENCPVCGAEGADLTQCAGTEAITEPVCTCETKCAEGSPNAECLVCGGESADLTQCVGVEEITEPDCTCEIRCSEGSLNEDCPVCGGEGANPAQCKGQPQAEPNLLTEEEDSATEPAMCSYESADRTVKSKYDVTLSEAVEKLNEHGGGTITVTSSGRVDCDNLVTSNITILPAKGSNSIKLTLAEVKDRRTSAMFRVENGCILTFGEAGLTEDSLIFSGGNLKDSCIVSVTDGYSTARLVIYDGVLITKCLGSAIGKHYDGSGVSSRSPHVEMYGGKVAYNGTAENRSHDSCIKARSFKMTGGEISDNYGGTAGAVEINDGVRINDDVYCDISGDAVIKNCHGSTVGAILGEGSHTNLSGDVQILDCIGGETGGVSCGSEATFSGNVLIQGCKGDAVGGIYASDPITLSGNVTIRDCGLIPVDPDDSLREYKENAGGIYAWDTLTIKDHVTIEDCTGNRGGAICLRYVFSVNPLGSSIGGNTVIRNNSAPYGGAIYVESRELEIEDNAQIINNTAENAGGGVYIAPLEKDSWSSYLDSLLIVSGGDIQGNKAPLGGGIYVSGTEEEDKKGYKPGKLALSGGSVTNNTAEEAGGGIYQCYDATVFVSGNPQVTENICDGTVNNLQLGWNGVDKPEDPEVTLEEFSAAFKQGEEAFTAIIMEVKLPPYVQEVESFFDSADPEDLAEIALLIDLTDFVEDDGNGNQVYVGTKDAFVDAYINFLSSSILKPQISKQYNSLMSLDQEQQEEALELYYHSLFSPGAEQYQIAHIAITAPLNGASIGITAENDSVGRLVAEGDIYETFSGFRDDESESKEPYQIIDQDVSAFSSDDPQYYISFASDNENQLVLNKNFKLTYDANGGTGAPGPDTNLPAGPYTLNSTTKPTYGSNIFLGWTADDSASGKIYEAGQQLPAIVPQVTIPNTTTVYAVWGADSNGDGTADAQQVLIVPADITVYQGGDGYDSVLDGTTEGSNVQSTGLPEPGYYITLPWQVNEDLKDTGAVADDEGIVNLSNYLSFTYNDGAGVERRWRIATYDADGNSRLSDGRYIYRILPDELTKTPIRLLFTNGAGDEFTSDDFFGIEDQLYDTLQMTIYRGDLEANYVQAQVVGTTALQDVGVGTGELVIRGTTNENPVSQIVTNAPSNVNQITAQAENVAYYINESPIQVQDPGTVRLLADELALTADTEPVMQEAAANAIQDTTLNNPQYDFMYLDLVDTSNGNAYVTLNQNNEDHAITIHWPMPANADPDSIHVVHFDGMDREFDVGDLSSYLGNVYEIENVDINGNVISFSTATFSPFVLVYEEDTSRPVNPNPGGGSGGDSDSDPTGNLSIELDVNGGDDEFTFTVILTDKDGDDLENNFYYNGDYTGTIGSGDEITLEGGDKIVIRNLPEGTRYEVIIETADGYTYVIDGEEGVIHTGMNEAEFTATRTVPVADPSVTGVSRWLNTTDHIAYLTGYPGGAFGPDNNMTRAEVAQMFYALLNNKNVTITKTFPDVPADAWYAAAVNTLASLGMVSGDENGNYRPNDPITRAEFCVIALAFAYEPENAVCYFGDVSRSDWFYTYVAQAASYGWIGGYTNGNFGPNDRITRAQVTTIVNNMLGRAADRDYVIDHQADLVQFTDLTRAHWGYFQIMEATNAHDYTKSNGTENWR